MAGRFPRGVSLPLTVALGLCLTAPATAAQEPAEQLLARAQQGDDAAHAALRTRATDGDTTSQYAMASLHADPNGPLGRDPVEVTRWLRLASEQGHEAAQLALGMYYLVGDGVPQDMVETERWFLRAAEQGNAQAQHNLGHLYQGLAEPDRSSDTVPLDHAASVRWFQRAAEQGHVSAATSLAVKYRDGNGIPMAIDQAFRWFLRAADLGDVEAMTEVGVMYAAGRGVALDDIAAYVWLDLAARHAGGEDREFVLRDREGVAQRLTARQIAEAERRANTWTPAQPQRK